MQLMSGVSAGRSGPARAGEVRAGPSSAGSPLALRSRPTGHPRLSSSSPPKVRKVEVSPSCEAAWPFSLLHWKNFIIFLSTVSGF